MPKQQVDFELVGFTYNAEHFSGVVLAQVKLKTTLGTEETAFGVDVPIPEGDLMDGAQKRKATTWDETDVIAWLKGNKGIGVTLAKRQSVPQPPRPQP